MIRSSHCGIIIAHLRARQRGLRKVALAALVVVLGARYCTFEWLLVFLNGWCEASHRNHVVPCDKKLAANDGFKNLVRDHWTLTNMLASSARSKPIKSWAISCFSSTAPLRPNKHSTWQSMTLNRNVLLFKITLWRSKRRGRTFHTNNKK